MKFHENHDFHWFLWFLSIFMKTGRARGAMPKHQVFLVVFIGIWEPFRPGAPLFAKMVKFRANDNILLHFTKFHEIPWFPSHFGVLGALGPHKNKISHLRHALKPQKVTFWEIRRDFAISALFAPKLNFLHISKKLCNFSVSGPQNQFFRPGASEKAPRTLRLWRVLRRGRPSPILGPKERFWAPKPRISQNFQYLDQNEGVPGYLEGVPGLFTNIS